MFRTESQKVSCLGSDSSLHMSEGCYLRHWECRGLEAAPFLARMARVA